MSPWIDVCALAELQPDSGVCALVAEQQVALFYFTQLQRVFAVANFDPIGQANVLSRGMVGDVHGEPMVASPLYKQHYSLQSGVCLENDAIRIPTYAVRIAADRVLVNMGSL